MKGHELKRLAQANEAARIDLTGNGPLTLAPAPGGGVLAWYKGAYGAAGVVVPDGAIDHPVSVGANEFAGLAALFEDAADVAVTTMPRSLELRSGRRRVSLRYNGQPDASLYEEQQALSVSAIVKLSEFSRLMRAAATMTAGSMAQPVLSGVRLVIKPGALGAQAANGVSLVFEGGIKADGESSVECIVPADVIVPMLSIFDPETEYLGLALDRNALVLATTSTVARLPLLGGAWPNLSATRATLTFPDRLIIPTSTIRNLTRAIRAYKADEFVVFEPGSSFEAADTVLIRTEESEGGVFEEYATGNLSRSYKFALSDLEAAGRISSAELQIALGDRMARVTGEGMRLLLLVRG